jgi:50S ribosomal protein L16 3-hydroxylase
VTNRLLGGLTASTFLHRHWQKIPLLVHGAVPGFGGLLGFDDMVELASRDDCESRLVWRIGNRWKVLHGPFDRKVISRLPERNWTLLVQGVDHFLPEARQLLSRFNFIPYSRLDDLMVSYAPPGGGVGPHFDSYDVFLLQGPGQRRWQISRQKDLALVVDSPLKILRRFTSQAECLLDPGDMLYLPPDVAHEGVAIGHSYTYSIGFRAPSHRELMSQFLVFLEERLTASGRYCDPDLKLQVHPAKLDAAMIAKVERTLGQIRWDRRDIVDFLGGYLTEPKAHVQFSPQRSPLSPPAFSRAASRRGVELAPASQMLYSGNMLFINGETLKIGGAAAWSLRSLADLRRLPARRVPRSGTAAEALYQWYRAGYIALAISSNTS